MDERETAEHIEARFSEVGRKVPLNEIETRLNTLINKFKVPAEEARRSVINYFLKEYNIPKDKFYTNPGAAKTLKVKDVKSDGQWVNIRGKVAQLWENSHETISQVGLIGDETGTIKFTKWSKAGLPPLEEGKSYLFKNVVTSEWQGQYSIKLNKTSEIIPLEEDLVVNQTQIEFSGVLVDIQAGSGLIKRCPECNRALIKGACGEHGKVEGSYDLRVKAILDNGIEVQDILLNKEVTEELTSITLDKAKAMATEALDQSVVLDTIKGKIVGRYYTGKGRKVDRYILIDTIRQESKITEAQIDEVLELAGANVMNSRNIAEEAV